MVTGNMYILKCIVEKHTNNNLLKYMLYELSQNSKHYRVLYLKYQLLEIKLYLKSQLLEIKVMNAWS